MTFLSVGFNVLVPHNISCTLKWQESVKSVEVGSGK